MTHKTVRANLETIHRRLLDRLEIAKLKGKEGITATDIIEVIELSVSWQKTRDYYEKLVGKWLTNQRGNSNTYLVRDRFVSYDLGTIEDESNKSLIKYLRAEKENDSKPEQN